MKKKRFFSCALVILSLIVMVSYTTKKDKQEQEQEKEQVEYSGIPDAVSSTTSDGDYDLTVVANTEEIEDKEEFARKVIHMCQDNSFHSTRFSTDIGGYPLNLDITVYLTYKDVEERKEPVCKIQFMTDEYNEEYDIKNNADKFHLYLDGEEIEFY